MVRRLVEDQQVGIAEQRAGQRHAHAPAAGELAARAAPGPSLSKPRPCRIAAARAGADGGADLVEPGMDLGEAQADRGRSRPRPAGAVRSTSAASTASSTVMSPPGGSCGTEPMRVRPIRLMLAAVGLDAGPGSARSRVDLPAPLRPTRPTFQPSDSGRRGAVEQHALAVAEGEVVDVQHGAAAFSTRKGAGPTGLPAETPRL